MSLRSLLGLTKDEAHATFVAGLILTGAGIDPAGADDSTAALQALLDTAAPYTDPVYGVRAFLPPGLFKVSEPLLIPRGVRLIGAGEASTVIQASAGLAGGAVVAPKHIDGTQEFMWVERMTIDPNGHAAIGLLLDSVFVNSAAVDVVVGPGTIHNIAIKATAGNCGPIRLTNVWCTGDGVTGQDRVLIDGAVKAAWLTDCTVEHPPAGYHGIKMTNGSGGASVAHKLHGVYCELDGAGSAVVYIEDVASVSLDTIIQNGAAAAGQAVVRLVGGDDQGNEFNPVNISCRNIVSGGTAVAIDDQARGISIPGPMVAAYETAALQLSNHGLNARGDLVTSGEILAAGGYKNLVQFVKTATAANVVNGVVGPIGIGSINNVPMPYAGSIIGIGIINNFGGGMAGTLTVSPAINGTKEVGVQTTIDATHQAHNFASVAPGVIPFNAGDVIGVYYDSTANWTPGPDILVSVVVLV